MRIWCETLVTDATTAHEVLIDVDDHGRILTLMPQSSPDSADLHLKTIMPGAANAHSHAFHRLLRGTTHGDGGDFWRWRDSMYAAVAALDARNYEEVATAVFAEMLVAGWTAVGEFHYLHRAPDRSPNAGADDSDADSGIAMELALVRAARATGIRLTLLDTVYLRGGADRELEGAQKRFSDGTVEAWHARWSGVADIIGALDDPRITLGAAIHSVRAVAREDIAIVLRLIPVDLPLHIHLSEQPAENIASHDEYGMSPTELLAALGALSPRLSAVHATHLTDRDIQLLGDAGAGIVMCPTTEADLGDGIGPARALSDAGASISLGSDQNAVIDPLLETRGLEAGERLSAGTRGRFSPGQLIAAMSSNGYRALGHPGTFGPGAWCDLIEVDSASVRTIGSRVDQLHYSATASDVTRVVVGGELVAEKGELVRRVASANGTPVHDPRVLLTDALDQLSR